MELRGGTSLRGIPSARGVLTIENGAGEPLLLASGARLRELASRRLEGERHATLAAEATRACWRLVGSPFAADVVFLDEAARRAPGVHEHVLDRWQGWFVLGDPSATHPVWEKVSTRRLGVMAERGEADPDLALGPFADKHAAGRAMQALDDAFDLCRYPEELRRAPRGRACAYKEMGRCPGACDGGETLDAYRGRVREAIDTMTVGVEQRSRQREAAMRVAAERLDFEAADRIKRWIEGAEPLRGRGARWARTLGTLRLAAVSRSSRPGWAVVSRVDAGRIAGVGAMRAEDDGREIVAALARAGGAAEPRLDRGSASVLGLVAAWLYAPKAERRGGVSFVRLGAGIDLGRELESAARRVLRPAGEDEADDERAMELA
jgi:hypothetical protein